MRQLPGRFDRRPVAAVAAGLLVLLATTPAARGQDDAPTDGEHEFPADEREVLEELERLREEVDELKARQSPAGGEEEAAPDATADRAAAGDEEGDRRELPGFKGGVYDKPFLKRVTPRAYVGGYFDTEYRNPEGAPHDFRFHRFIPFLYADIAERVKFASEIEIEDGSEVAMEFAFLDLLLLREANVRGGVILDPLGKFNLIHDSPINDLTDRPLINRFVIPTTFREIGAGLFGTLTPEGSVWQVDYEAYATSGFKGLDAAGMAAFDRVSGIRGGRASTEALGTRHFGDINNDFAGVGRLSVSPMIGTEVGVSGYTGTYDERGRNDLTILAVDGLYTLSQFRLGEVVEPLRDTCLGDLPIGPVELQGEFAYDFIERDGLAGASGDPGDPLTGVPGDLWGYYVQMNYHFMPEYLTENAPVLFFPGSTFTFVTRWGQIDLDGNRRRRLTLGLNYRPVESTVIKFDYQLNRGTGLAPDSADRDAFLVSIASYF